MFVTDLRNWTKGILLLVALDARLTDLSYEAKNVFNCM